MRELRHENGLMKPLNTHKIEGLRR